MRVAHEAEKAEEEELMKRALEESQKLEDKAKKAEEEEAEMIRQAIEMSRLEEEKKKAL